MGAAFPNHEGMAVWFTGLSGAGKTTLAQRTAVELQARGCRVAVLDGDEMRRQLSPELGFSKADRDTNIARIGYITGLLVKQQVIVLVAAISPYRRARSLVREQVGKFVEIYVNAPLEVCIARDPKQLYARALKGELTHCTGIDDPYEAPLSPEVECHTGRESCDESVAKVLLAIERALPRQGNAGQ